MGCLSGTKLFFVTHKTKEGCCIEGLRHRSDMCHECRRGDQEGKEAEDGRKIYTIWSMTLTRKHSAELVFTYSRRYRLVEQEMGGRVGGGFEGRL